MEQTYFVLIYKESWLKYLQSKSELFAELDDYGVQQS